MQVLEGTEENLAFVLDRIEGDNSHRNIIVLTHSGIPERNFKSWRMGFRAFNGDISGTNHVIKLLEMKQTVEEGGAEDFIENPDADSIAVLRTFTKNL